MKVSLAVTDDGRRLFSAEAPESHDDPVTHHGLRGWVERKAKALKTKWNHADRGVTGKVRHAWEWLNKRVPADEPMLVRLRTAPSIEIHHPSSISSDEARALWSEYLANRRRRHLPWLGVNAVVSPLTVLLAPLPGPNVVGYWFAYRAVRDLLAVLGLRRARSDRVETTFHPTAALDRPLGEGKEPPAGSSMLQGGVEEIDGRTSRQGIPRDGQGNPPAFSLAANRAEG
jgi:hypothetical protein